MTATRTVPRVVCAIPHTAPGLINGVLFEQVEGTDTLVSVGDIEPGTLAIFGAIPGYSVSHVEVPAEPVKAPGKPAADPVAGAAGAETSIESKAHADGTTVTGKAPLPDQSPDEQAAAAAASTQTEAGVGLVTESAGDQQADKALGAAGEGAGQGADAAAGGDGATADAELEAARALLGGKPDVKTKAAAKTTAKTKAAAPK